MYRVLVVDDDLELRQTVSEALTQSDFRVDQARDGEEAINRVRAAKYDLVLLDVNMPKLTGIQALQEIRAFDPSIVVLILTAFSNVRDAVEATKLGAYNYLEKPIKAENLVYLVERALKAQRLVKDMTLSSPVFRLPSGTEFVGQSDEMKKIFSVIDKLAKVDTAVLIRGESGTGKELVAQALHFHSPRKDQRFVTVNCSAIPENLIESEFFGHERGAFTGADSRKIGKFQYADGGTLFLDEIGDISPAMQVKLLRALQEKKFTPIGSNREIEVNVRIVAATNRNLEEMIRKNEFREDLFYRLNVLPIQLPPLRERRNDIRHLARYFMDKFNGEHKKAITGIAPDAMEILEQFGWPGNIRELENVIEHAFVIETGNQITIESLPESVKKCASSSIAAPSSASLKAEEPPSTLDERFTDVVLTSGEEDSLTIEDEGVDPNALRFEIQLQRLDFQASKEEFEKTFLINALKKFGGRINQTALHSNIPKKTLLRKLEKYGIIAREFTQNKNG